MYKRILVPLDGSKRAEVILPHVEDLARRYNAKVILLSIVEYEPTVVATEPIYASFDPQERQQRLDNTKAYLAEIQEHFREKDIEAQICLGNGSVVPEIIGTAERENVDLLAMVSHGHTGLARVFYGSVAAGVLHRVDRPLLLIRSLDKD